MILVLPVMNVMVKKEGSSPKKKVNVDDKVVINLFRMALATNTEITLLHSLYIHSLFNLDSSSPNDA